MDRRGRIRRRVVVPVAIRRPGPGRAEHDAEVLFRSVASALRLVLRGIDPARIAAVGLSCQRSTFLFWDSDSGRPLTPALSWQDRRGEDLCRSLSRHDRMVRARTGLRLSPHYAASKIRWLLDGSAALRRRAERGEARGGTLDAYLLYRLTGGDSWSTDPTQAARTLLMDLNRMEWDPELLRLFRIPLRALPPIRPSAFPAGVIRHRGKGLRIAATLGDQQAALIGLGCRGEGEAAVNYGTGAFLVLNTGARPRRLPGLLTSVAWSSEREIRYLLEGTVNAAGSAVEWIERLTGMKTGSSGALPPPERLPLVVPAFSGLGAPHWAAGARAAICGLDFSTGPEELAAGTLAGIACRVNEIAETMGRGGLRPRRIVAGGGLAARKGLLPLQAALLGRGIERSLAAEGSCRGAAILAGHSRGDWDLTRDRRLEFPAETVAPGVSAAAARRLAWRFRRARQFVASESDSD
jgi:glycerol kinase